MRPSEWNPFQWMLFLGIVWTIAGLIVHYSERRKK